MTCPSCGRVLEEHSQEAREHCALGFITEYRGPEHVKGPSWESIVGEPESAFHDDGECPF